MATKTKMSDQEYREKYGEKLADSVRRAKWVSAVDEHEDHKGQALVTRDHAVIKRWAEKRGARPATISGTEHDGRVGTLRFDFPGGAEADRLEHMSWDQWSETFDERELVMMYQEHRSDGAESNFYRFDNPHREGA